MKRLFMVVESKSVSLHTHREGEIVDITSKVQAILERGNLSDGVAFLFVPGSTGALTTIEYEPGLLTDFPASLDRLAPKDAPYEHENRWHDGTLQQIVFLELDIRPRDRTIVVQLVGD